MSNNFVHLIDKKYLEEVSKDSRYDNSPFVHLKHLMPRQKGARFEKIVECIHLKLGYNVDKALSSDYDRMINNKKCEIKGSTLVKDKNIFSFLQIRPEQDYDMIIFAMFYPQDVVMMKMEKSLVEKLVNDGTFKMQHGGKKSKSKTYCYYGNEVDLEKLGAKRFHG